MAKKSKSKRIWITLECQNMVDGLKCAERNYTSSKNKMNTPDRLQRNKYCSTCKAATIHKETK